MASYSNVPANDDKTVLPTRPSGSEECEVIFLEPAGAGNKQKDECDYERSQWANKREYILSTLGYCVGVGNLWRFPYICIRNGGGAFLIPFFLSLLLFGLPLFFLETVLGQFTSRSPLHVWCICPLFKGVGIGMCVLSAIVYWYYNTILAWALYYLVSSFQSTLPWSKCGQWWNTPNCAVFSVRSGHNAAVNDSMMDANVSIVTNSSLGVGVVSSTLGNMTDAGVNSTHVKMISSAEEFWQHNVLRVSSGFEEPGEVVWYLAITLAVSCLFLFLGMIKGIKSSGKVVYVTATAPYILLTILLVRGVTLPGAKDGILFYLRPDWAKLLDPLVWVEAALQVFWSLGPCWGTIIAMASYNKFNNNCLKDSIFLTFACEGTSFYAGFAIFSVLGYMARESGVPVDKAVSSGPGLAFIVYPEAVSLMPLPQLWAVLFFLMVITLCFDSEIAYGETVMTVFSDYFPKFMARNRTIITASFCGVCFLLQLPFITEGGIYIFQLVDWYTAAITLILIGVIECIVIGWVYGAERFEKDVMQMLGQRPPVVFRVLWRFVTPLLLSTLFIFTLVRYEAPTYGDYQYGTGGVLFGWLIGVVSFVPIPVLAFCHLYLAPGDLMNKLRTTLKADDNWKPADSGNYEDKESDDFPDYP